MRQHHTTPLIYNGEVFETGRRSLFQEPRCHTWVAIAVAAVSVGVGAYSASEQAGAVKDAADRQATATRNANSQNFWLDLFKRGAPLFGDDVPTNLKGAQSAVLPYYFGDQEAKMGQDATNLYRASNAFYGSPDQELAGYRNIVGEYAPAIAGNRQLVDDLASGRVTDQMLAEAKPAMVERVAGAEANRNAGIESLQETLNQIDDIQAGKGFSGDTSGNQMLKFNARRAIGDKAATDLHSALLANALTKQSIRDQGRQMRLGAVNLPAQLAQSDINLAQLPGAAAASRNNTSQTPFTFFRTTNGFQPYQTLPTAPATATTGQIVGEAVGSLGGGISNYLLQRQLQQQAIAGAGTGGGAAATFRDYSTSPSFASQYGSI